MSSNSFKLVPSQASLVSLVCRADEDNEQEQSQTSPFSDFLVPLSWILPMWTANRNSLERAPSLTFSCPSRRPMPKWTANRNSLKRAPSQTSRVQTYETPEKTAMGSSLVHIPPLLPAFLPWVVSAKEDDKLGTVSCIFLPSVPCVSPAGGAEEDGEQEQSQTKDSPRHLLKLFRGRGRVR